MFEGSAFGVLLDTPFQQVRCDWRDESYGLSILLSVKRWLSETIPLVACSSSGTTLKQVASTIRAKNSRPPLMVLLTPAFV